MNTSKKENYKRTKQQALTQKETTNKKQKRKTWNASLDKKFIDIVVKLGGSQAAIPKKIIEHMKDDDITIWEIQKHLQIFRRKTNIVDIFVKTNQQPSFVDTQDWTQQMLYYFKERWEEEGRRKKQTTHDVAVVNTTEITVQNNTNMSKPMSKKRKKQNNVICDKSKETKKQVADKSFLSTIIHLCNYKRVTYIEITFQKYTTWSWEMCKKFIHIVVELGGCQDATPKRIIQHMKEDNVTLSEVQNHFKKFKAKTKMVDNYVINNQQPTISETTKWSEEMLYYFQESCESRQGTQDQIPAEYKGISKEYIDIGDPTQACKSCKAKIWRGETKTKGIKEEDSFSMCCKKGEVEIPKMATPPKELLELYTGNDKISKRSSSEKPSEKVEKQDLLIAQKIKKILDKNNPLVQKFRMVGDRIEGLVLDRDVILNIALVKIDQLLRSRGKSLNDIQHMPVPDYRNKQDWSNPLIQEELSFKKKDMEEEHASLPKSRCNCVDYGFRQVNRVRMSRYRRVAFTALSKMVLTSDIDEACSV
ncbi:DNA helicase Pif1-like protein [Artemisia annua]|uniref:DNA helicase Pif1-like protein n=1 Tax=Artemisia annua TaxID=35608 RepID=A0A2U1P448_ARTAN|nr:DNA helicase Pif1-like protein [Artemisia annua]